MVSTSNGVSVNSNSITVTVYPQLVSGTVSPATQTINYNTAAGTLTGTAATGGNGTITYQWQSSPNNSTWTNISGATALTYAPGTLTATTYYHLVSTSSGVNVTSGTATVTVYPQLVSGAISPATQTINYSTAAGTLTATAATGGNSSYTYQWQSSPNNSTWTNISGATALTYAPGTLTATTYYHLISTSNGASVTSGSATVTVYPQLVSSVIGPPTQNINYNGTGGMSGNAATGGNGIYTYQWQNSPNNSTWTNISGATALSYTTGNLTATTYYRMVSTSNGVSVNSNSITVTVYPQLVSGTVSPATQTINYNTAAGTLTGTAATGGNGTITYQWQSSPNNSTWTNISGATALTYAPGTLTATTYYHLVSTSNGVAVTSSLATVTVYTQLVSGTVSPATQTINYNAAAGTLTGTAATGGNGTITYQWQSSPNNSTWTNISGATALTYAPAALTATTYYHLISTSNGVSVTSGSATVTVYPRLVAGAITSGGQKVVYNTVPTPISASTATGGNGTITYQWQSSLTNIAGSFSNVTTGTGATTTTYQPPSLNVTTYYHLTYTSNGVSVNSNTCTVTAVPFIIASAPSNPSNDSNLNWIMTRSYDENGNEIGTSKAFFDNNGKAIQTQIKNETAGQVLASQTIYDLQGRAVMTTLPAPTNNSAFAYKSNFVTAGGVAYSYLNFDGDPTNATNPYAKLNSPDPVDNTTVGSLGWYYSNNNTFEPMAAATSYPYSRSDFYRDGTGAAKRSAGIGDQLKMGMGHEATSNSFPVQNELNNYLAIRNAFFPSSVVGIGTPTTLAGQALQSVSTDPNGTSALSVTDLSGKQTLMTGRADPAAGAWLTVTNTVTATANRADFEVNINTAIGNYGAFVLNTEQPVTVYLNGAVVYTGIGSQYGQINDYNPGVGGGGTYLVTSVYPFSYTYSDYQANVGQVSNTVQVAFNESATSQQYFRLTAPSAVTIAGGTYTLYDMTAEADITSTYQGNNTLPAGYYKVVATAPPALGSVATNTVTATYANKYSDISYNYYNQLGQLVASISPKGVQTLLQNGYSSYTSASQLPFVTLYYYDLQGRPLSATSSDGGTFNFIYRQDDKIRFSQNSHQANSANFGSGLERFSYINYDSFGRAVESGEYQTSAGTFAALGTNATVLAATDPTGGLSGGTKVSQINIYYDLPGTTGVTGYSQDPGFLKGAVSYTTRAANGVINSTTYYNYDDHGRVSWLVKVIGGLGPKTTDYTYDNMGNVLTVDYQKGTTGERFTHYYNYDADGRLINVQTSTNGGTTKTQQANYYYYLHGPLKRVELGNQVQGMDYIYTPQGWLKAINSPTGNAANDPMKDGSANGFATDAFGMQLEYFPGDYSRTGSNVTDIPTGTQNYYNGNVTGMSWQSNTPSGIPNPPTMYTYTYDNKYEYTGSTMGTPAFTGTGAPSFTAGTKFSEKNIGYDANGNITGLQRTNASGILSDDFSKYIYKPTNNQLNSVANTAGSSVYSTYSYDEIGRLSTQTKGATTYYLQYDVTGKITAIYTNPAMTPAYLLESYTYDENGSRITTTNAQGTTYNVYDVSGNVLAVYNGATPALTEVPIYGSRRLGTYFTTGPLSVYEIRDNVGSVRVAFTGTKTTGGQANIYNYSDFYPYGSLAQSAGTNYRYAYQGANAESDGVTSYNNFNLRMYDGKIGRWLSVDPNGQFASPYEGMGDEPVTGNDPTGGSDTTFVDENTGKSTTIASNIPVNATVVGTQNWTATGNWRFTYYPSQTTYAPNPNYVPPSSDEPAAEDGEAWENFNKLLSNVNDDANNTANILRTGEGALKNLAKATESSSYIFMANDVYTGVRKDIGKDGYHYGKNTQNALQHVSATVLGTTYGAYAGAAFLGTITGGNPVGIWAGWVIGGIVGGYVADKLAGMADN